MGQSSSIILPLIVSMLLLLSGRDTYSFTTAIFSRLQVLCLKAHLDAVCPEHSVPHGCGIYSPCGIRHGRVLNDEIIKGPRSVRSREGNVTWQPPISRMACAGEFVSQRRCWTACVDGLGDAVDLVGCRASNRKAVGTERGRAVIVPRRRVVVGRKTVDLAVVGPASCEPVSAARLPASHHPDHICSLRGAAFCRRCEYGRQSA